MARIVRGSVLLWAIMSLCLLVRAVTVIAAESWGSVVQIVWLKPGDEFASIRFVTFAAVAVTFVAGGVAVFKSPRWGMYLCAAGFISAIAALHALTPTVPTPDEWLLSILFFVAPALVYVRYGSRARQQSLHNHPSGSVST